MTEKNFENLYFIAIIPPEPIYGEALALKHHLKNQYNSKAALNSPPHITLHMPFAWKESKEEELINSLETFSVGQNQLEIRLNNFSAFEPRVIFIDVIKDEKLEGLQKQLKRFCKAELNLFNADYKELAYHPHITLAFRDLKKVEFYKAWEEFKNRKFDATFDVNSIALLKHDGKEWKEFKQHPLKN
jgi:2'-5' RNA ligase